VIFLFLFDFGEEFLGLLVEYFQFYSRISSGFYLKRQSGDWRGNFFYFIGDFLFYFYFTRQFGWVTRGF
jgi:hypothetical protein